MAIKNPISVSDLHASVFTAMGVSPKSRALLADMKLDDDLALIPKFDLGWQHALSRATPGQLATYQNAGTSFLVLGTPLAMDAVAVAIRAAPIPIDVPPEWSA